MSGLTLKEFMLVEAEEEIRHRKPELHYTEKKVKGILDRVTVELAGNDSAIFTNLGKRVARLAKAIERMKKRHEDLKGKLRGDVDNLFSSQDIYLTKVVETMQLVLTLAKTSQKTDPKVHMDSDAILREIYDLIPEDLQAKAEEIIRNYTIIEQAEPKTPNITIKQKDQPDEKIEEGLDQFIAKVKRIAGSLLKMISGWAVKFDKKLGKLKKRAEALS